jgi:putative glutamine amidotransferase
MAPIIGIAACRTIADYVEAVRRAGGEPRVLDPARDHAREVIAEVDGLLLTGGGDIDPALYGHRAHPSTKIVPSERDRFELELARGAMDGDLPFLGICRGEQVMNVAGGGTLIQDIPSEVAGALTHSIDAPLRAPAHEVWVSRGSRLWTAMQEQVGDSETLQVNSRHHQAINRVGQGLDVCATAPDGVIEAIEKPRLRFCIGVQWHPENFWRTGEFQSLFENFIAACETGDRR